MNEETLIEQRLEKREFFRVPEGYFNGLEKRLLESVDVSAHERKPAFRRLRPWLWASGAAAAVVCGFAFYIGKPFAESAPKSSVAASIAASAHDNTDYIIEKMSDYAMLDNSDFYSYVEDY